MRRHYFFLVQVKSSTYCIFIYMIKWRVILFLNLHWWGNRKEGSMNILYEMNGNLLSAPLTDRLVWTSVFLCVLWGRVKPLSKSFKSHRRCKIIFPCCQHQGKTHLDRWWGASGVFSVDMSNNNHNNYQTSEYRYIPNGFMGFHIHSEQSRREHNGKMCFIFESWWIYELNRFPRYHWVRQVYVCICLGCIQFESKWLLPCACLCPFSLTIS